MKPLTETLTEELQRSEADNDDLRKERDDARDLCLEAWDWVAVALHAGGWKTVFDIPEWKKRSEQLEDDPEFYGKTRGSQLTKLREDNDRLRRENEGIRLAGDELVSAMERLEAARFAPLEVERWKTLTRGVK